MKKSVLFLVIAVLLMSITAVIAKPIVTDKIQFSGQDITSTAFRVGKQSNSYIWGKFPSDNYDGGEWEAKVTIKSDYLNLEYTDHYVNGTNITWKCSGELTPGEYWSGGWVSFDTRIKVGQTTPLTDFRMDLKKYPATQGYLNYTLWTLNPYDPNKFYAERTDEGYIIVSNNYMIYTRGWLDCLSDVGYKHQFLSVSLPWTFTATITLK
jgi:hypothetical protein